MSKNKSKPNQDRARQERERRARQAQEREAARAAKEAEKAAQRAEREAQEQEEQTPPQALVVASIQVFNQVPPTQVYVLTDGSTISSPDTPPALVEALRHSIMTALTPPQEEDATEAEIPVDPSPATPQDQDDDGLTPEDYAALEGATTQDLIVPVPKGMSMDDARWAIADGITRRLAENQKGGI